MTARNYRVFTVGEAMLEKGMAPTPVFLPGDSQGRGSLAGCRLWVAQSRARLSHSAVAAAEAGSVRICRQQSSSLPLATSPLVAIVLFSVSVTLFVF